MKVIDGDSIVVRHDRTEVEIRLLDIDAPEMNQPFGRRAAEDLRGLILGRKVRVSERGKDRSGRTLARVYSVHGLELNIYLIESGRAWWFRKYAPDCSICEHEEKKARKQKRGLWARPNPVPPWEWRKGIRS